MHHPDIILLALLAAVGVLLVLSRLSRIPYPIVLVVGGMLLGFVPGVPSVVVPPNFILLLVLPPLVFYAALVYQARRLRANVGSISLLAIGLLISTTVGVAAVAHALIGLPWGVAFVLGAVLSPTDPVAATAIASRLGAPRRVTSVIEGESLINDGAALAVYAAAVGAVISGEFALGAAALDFPVTIVGGIAMGLLVAWFMSWALLRRLGSGYHQTVLVLLTAYLAYLSADVLGLSGVLAAVSAGIYIGRRLPVDDAATDRIAGYAFFEVLVFVINTLVFILMGLQFPVIVERISEYPAGMLLLWAVAINLTVIALRMAWTMGLDQIVFRIRRPRPAWGQSLVIGWAGMRGAVSLAAAQAVPIELADGTPFPHRDLILFLTITVIFVTVVLQGLSLPALIHWLRLGSDRDRYRAEIHRARRLGAQAALQRIEQLREEDWLPARIADLYVDLYSHRSDALAQGLNEDEDGDDYDDETDHEERYDALLRLRRELVDVERSELLRLNRTGAISDDAMRRVERMLDLEVTRLSY